MQFRQESGTTPRAKIGLADGQRWTGGVSDDSLHQTVPWMSDADIAHFRMQAHEVFQLQDGVLFRLFGHTQTQLAVWELQLVLWVGG